MRPPSRQPLATYELDRGDSILAELRGRGGRADDFPAAFPAEAIGPDHTAVRAVERFQVDGRPLLFFRPDLSAPVVDAARASDLTVADPTRMGPGDEAEVGRFAPEVVAGLGHRGLLELLLRAEVLRVYWHIGATLALEAERRDGGAYEADLAGAHVYFTNARNEQRVAFTLRVGPDGAVTVRGRG